MASTQEKTEKYARALYSNKADHPGELDFKKGDWFVVVEEKTGVNGISSGWWTCINNKGKKGIVPANRLTIMQRFDNGFFKVANPIFNDFFMGTSSSPFDDPFFGDRRRSFLPVDPLLGSLSSISRDSSRDPPRGDGIIRNIPIRVIQTSSASDRDDVTSLREFPIERRHSDFPQSNHIRRTVSSGRLSPPIPPIRRSNPIEERPQRTLFIPSSIPGRTIEIPLGNSSSNVSSRDIPSVQEKRRSISPKADTQMDKLTQRLRNLANKPFRPLDSRLSGSAPRLEHRLSDSSPRLSQVSRFSDSLPRLIDTIEIQKEDRSASPSSSGICTDINDSSEETKRISEGSLSSGADINSDDQPRLLPPALFHHPYQSHIIRPSRELPNTSVLQAVFDNLDRPNGWNPVRGSDWAERDMMKNEKQHWTQVPTFILDNQDSHDVELNYAKTATLRRLTEWLNKIISEVATINKLTLPQNWRAPHVLLPLLNRLKDAIYTSSEALTQLIDSTARISIDRSNPKANELSRILRPLINYRNEIFSLRKSLDESGWIVAVLSRDRDQIKTSDSLDKIIIKLNEVTTPSHQLLEWAELLNPSSTIQFLPPLQAKRLQEPSSPLPTTTTTASLPQSTTTITPIQNDILNVNNRRHSNSSASNSSTNSTETSLPSSILISKPIDKPRGKVTFADENGDRSSTGSSIDQNSLDGPIPISNNISNEERIVEEDDLESVMSDRESLFQDYAYLDDVVPGRKEASRNANNIRINEEDRQLVRLYCIQLESHSEAISKGVEDFLSVVENNLPPSYFVQKGKLLIVTAHKLIYIGDTISQCIREQSVSQSIRNAADRLCEALKDCVRATKLAADEHPDLKCMQSMVDSVIEVSKLSHSIKQLVLQYC